MLDTFLPASGQSYFDIAPYKERIRAAADEGLTAMPRRMRDHIASSKIDHGSP
jgi:hypothetical protein